MKKKTQIIAPLFFTSLAVVLYGLRATWKKVFQISGNVLFITNEGNFQYGNASLSYYDMETEKVENNVFYRANGRK